MVDRSVGPGGLSLLHVASRGSDRSSACCKCLQAARCQFARSCRRGHPGFWGGAEKYMSAPSRRVTKPGRPVIVEVPVGPKLEANGPLLCGATGRSCRHRHPRRLASSAGADTPADDVLNDREVDAPAGAQPEGSVE